MATIDITIQAATDAALSALLIQHGVIIPGEGGIPNAPGVLYSHIGDAMLDGVQLDGRYAFVGIDDAVFGVARAAQLLVDLAEHRYMGPAVRLRSGGASYNPDTIQAIKNERDRRQQTGGFPMPIGGGATAWFHSDLHSRSQQNTLISGAILTLLMGGKVADPLMSGGSQVEWSLMDGSKLPLTVQIVFGLMAAASAQESAIHNVAKAAIAAAEGNPAFDIASITWPAGFVA